MASTATTAAPDARSRLRVSARLRSARSAAIRSRALALALAARADLPDLPAAGRLVLGTDCSLRLWHRVWHLPPLVLLSRIGVPECSRQPGGGGADPLPEARIVDHEAVVVHGQV